MPAEVHARQCVCVCVCACECVCECVCVLCVCARARRGWVRCVCWRVRGQAGPDRLITIAPASPSATCAPQTLCAGAALACERGRAATAVRRTSLQQLAEFDERILDKVRLVLLVGLPVRSERTANGAQRLPCGSTSSGRGAKGRGVAQGRGGPCSARTCSGCRCFGSSR
jgi:hypothetical protein